MPLSVEVDSRFFSAQQREMKPEESMPTHSLLTASPPLRRFSAE
jgi:hypothetical protein